MVQKWVGNTLLYVSIESSKILLEFNKLEKGKSSIIHQLKWLNFHQYVMGLKLQIPGGKAVDQRCGDKIPLSKQPNVGHRAKVIGCINTT